MSRNIQEIPDEIDTNADGQVEAAFAEFMLRYGEPTAVDKQNKQVIKTTKATTVPVVRDEASASQAPESLTAVRQMRDVANAITHSVLDKRKTRLATNHLTRLIILAIASSSFSLVLALNVVLLRSPLYFSALACYVISIFLATRIVLDYRKLVQPTAP